MKKSILASLCLLGLSILPAQASYPNCDSYVTNVYPMHVTVTEGQAAPIGGSFNFYTLANTPVSYSQGVPVYQIGWNLSMDQSWGRIASGASGVIVSGGNYLPMASTFIIYPQQLTVPSGMTQKRYTLTIRGASGLNKIYVTVKKPSTGGGSLSWSVSPTSSSIIVTNGSFTKSLSITNNGTQTLNWSASETSSALRLSRTSGSLGPNASATVYVYGTVSSAGSGTVRISDQTGSAKNVSLSWRVFNFKRADHQFADAFFNEAVMLYDLDGDGRLSEVERWSVTELRLNDLGIEDITGIDAFPNLRYLDVSGNRLSSLPDLGPLENLVILKANDNFLEAQPKALPEKVQFVEVHNNSF